jgi:hypothetical protein
LLRDQQALFVMANRMSALIASRFKSLVTVLLMLALALPPAMAAPVLRQAPVVFPPVNVDAQTLFNAISNAPKVSAYVDAQFVFDCVKGFPEGYWQDAYYGAGAAGVATEIAATAYSPKIYVLQSGNLIVTYFGDWTGPKMMQRLTGFLDRVPPRDEGERLLKIVWQNVYPAHYQQTGRDRTRDPRDQDDCQACMRAVVNLAHRKKRTAEEDAVYAAGVIALGCLALSGPLWAVCVAAAAATYAILKRKAELEYQDRILSAKNDECSTDRKTGKSCQWER